MNRRELLSLPGAFPLGEAVGSQTPSAARPSDIGNLYGTLDWISGQNQRDLSFLSDRWKSIAGWKQAGRAALQERLSYSPPSVPLRGEVVARETRDRFSVETIRLSATPAYDIPLRVLVPDGGPARRPAVLVLHCHGGKYYWGHEKVLSSPDDPADLQEFRGQMYGRPYAEELVRRGFVVAVADAFYFGARRLNVEELASLEVRDPVASAMRRLAPLRPHTPEWRAAVNVACGAYEHLVAKSIFAAGATWPGILAWDDMRCVDYLVGRADVDSRRIGAVGLSIGGLRTAHLAAADPRLKVACVVGWMTRFRSQLHHHLQHHTWMAYIPGLYQRMDLPDAAAMIAPNALMVQQCAKDALFPVSGMQAALDHLAAIFRKAGVPERFQGTFHDVPHSFRPEMQEEAFRWLERWI